MIRVHVISPENEVAVVEQLEREVRACWPEIAASISDRIDLLVGVRVGVDVDLLIVLDLAEPRALGEPPSTGGDFVGCGLIAVEIKQLDAQRIERFGNQLFARYGGQRSQKSVMDQAHAEARGVKFFAAANGQPNLYVHALTWLPQVDVAHLRGIDSAVMGRQGGWLGLMAAALRQNDWLRRCDPASLAKIRAVRDRLLVQHTLSPLDRAKAARIAKDAMLSTTVRELTACAGKRLVRLAGHGGSGKTTALTLMASRLTTAFGARVLVLSFHQTLCGDIRSILDAMPDAQAHAGKNLCVKTGSGFMMSLLSAIGEVPLDAEGAVDYKRLDNAYQEA